MTSVVPALSFVLQVFVTLLHIREAVAISDSDSCPDGYIIFKSERFNQKCIKVSTEPKTWTEANKICKSDLGYLINMDSPSSFSFISSTSERTVYFTNFTFDKGVTEFWTGMHIREGRLVWDGFPVKIVSRSFYASQFDTDWSWEAGEPSELRECGKMKQNLSLLTFFDQSRNQSVNETRPSGKYMAALAPCEKRLPFTCERFVTSTGDLKHTSSCPDGWIGNKELDACYRIFRNSLTFEDASHFCRQLKGSMMSTFSDFESSISRSVYNWFKNNDACEPHLDPTLFNVTTLEGCKMADSWLKVLSLASHNSKFLALEVFWYGYIQPVSAVHWLLIQLVYITVTLHCHLRARCQPNITIYSEFSFTTPEEMTVYSPYEDQSELLNSRPFSPLPVIFTMARPPSENEILIAEHNGQEVFNKTK